MSHLIIGAGEVGSALASVTGWAIRDIDPPETDGHFDWLEVAIPFGEEFTRIVTEYQDLYASSKVVVHSTVPPGTCDPRGWTHSPVRGRHPGLGAALGTFVKFFGGRDAIDAAHEWTVSVAMTTPLAVTTEIAKLYELVSFGVAVATEKAVWEACEQWGADYEIAYGLFGTTYNIGYDTLGDPQFRKPILSHHPGPIGGHCVRSSMAFCDHPLARLVETAGEDKG